MIPSVIVMIPVVSVPAIIPFIYTHMSLLIVSFNVAYIGRRIRCNSATDASMVSFDRRPTS
jgi:hypothetical protein